MTVRVVMKKRTVGDNATDGGRTYRTADGLALDSSYRTLAAARQSLSVPIVFDLSELDYLNHETLLYLGALLRYRVRLGFETHFELPTNRNVWEFMRAWHFPQFIAAVAGRPFADMLTPSSLPQFIRSETEALQYAKVIDLPGGGMSELLPTDHFLITPIDLSDNPFRAATIAQSAWLERHTVAVLNAYLGGMGGRVGSLVVMEAVLNAAMHPDATMAFTSSQIILPPPHELSGRKKLQIAVWDDGLSLSHTLKRRLDRGQSITSPAFEAFEETFNIRLVRASGTAETRILKSGTTELATETPWLMAAAFMAGVTSLPDRPAEQTGGSIRTGDFGLNLPGMGLRYIRRNVLNLWNGEIRYWTSTYRLSMRAGDEPDTYSVTVVYRPQSAWPLQGNLLYLDIPLGIPNDGSDDV